MVGVAMTGRDAILARVRAALVDRPPAAVGAAGLSAGAEQQTPPRCSSCSSSGSGTTRRQSSSRAIRERRRPRPSPRPAHGGSGSPPTSTACSARRGSISSRTTALAARELDALDGALTTCAAGCAETGTIALDGGPGQGRRALSLVPDLHVCIVRAEAIVETVPELIAALEPSARAGRPIVLVSGPSATSDIELNRVEGVHGPRRLVVIVAIGLV